jgi:L-ascorbate metabolism protein UlaG (beta-lactamase superfamily)
MISRRKFLAGVGAGLASTSFLVGRENGRRRTRWEMIAHDEPVEAPRFKPEPLSWDDSTITAAWIGHATILINFFGTTILTDPVFSERIGLDIAGLFTLGPQRLVAPALDFEELPPIDILLVSHAHMDHLDTPSLRRFKRSTPIVMAKNTLDVIEPIGFEEIYELDWGQWTRIGDVRIEALEVKHFGWRFPWEKDRSRGYRDGRSYNAYLVSQGSHSIFFAGDTAYQEMFKKVRDRNIPVSLAIMPIGAYDPWIANHASPEQAVQMADHLGAYHLLPMHWRTFVQSEEPTLEPIQRLKQALSEKPDRMVLDAIGQTWRLGMEIVNERTPVAPENPGADPHYR